MKSVFECACGKIMQIAEKNVGGKAVFGRFNDRYACSCGATTVMGSKWRPEHKRYEVD